VTTHRHNLLGNRHLTRLDKIVRTVCADFETELTERNGDDNHAHLPVNSPPKIAISKLTTNLESGSSRRMRQELPEPAHHYRRAQRLRSGSYIAGAVAGAPVSVRRQYHIEQQNRPVQDTLGHDRRPREPSPPGRRLAPWPALPVAEGFPQHAVVAGRPGDVAVGPDQASARDRETRSGGT
jgi:putative transposase